MSINIKKELLYHSDIAPIPWILFAVTQYFIPDLYALALAIAIWSGCMLYCIKKKYDFVYLIRLKVAGGVLFTLIPCLLLLPISEKYVTLLAELILFFILWFLYTFKSNIRKKYLKRSKPKNASDMSVSLSEFFLMSSVYLNALLFHFSIAFLYFIMLDEHHSSLRDIYIYDVPGIVFITSVMFFSFVRTYFIRKRLQMEDWLPIVNETGVVIGRVARSVSFNSHGQYLHPTVRIAVVYKGLLYIRERSACELLNPCEYDHPFERYVYYAQTLGQAVVSALKTVPGGSRHEPRFVFKYLYETVGVRQLVHLYSLFVHDEETMKTFKSLHGRTWTEKQIEENLGKNIFSECFEKEYEFLKNTVLMAEKFVSDHQPKPGLFV